MWINGNNCFRYTNFFSTANLAAFLTIETPYEKIKSVDDLKNCGISDEQCPVKFGAKQGGATYNFFKDSGHPTYRSMFKYMEV